MARGRSSYKGADAFTKRARSEGFPARSVFKLEEIDRRVRLFRAGQRVLDLGAAPGSWSLYAAEKVGPTGRVLAVDLSPMAHPPGDRVVVLQADALDLTDETLGMFAPYDVVMSDMAPKTSGSKVADQARSEALVEGAVAVAARLGKAGSAFVGKLFMGGGFQTIRATLAAAYRDVRVMRPEATRAQSSEVFLVALGKRSESAERAGSSAHEPGRREPGPP